MSTTTASTLPTAVDVTAGGATVWSNPTNVLTTNATFASQISQGYAANRIMVVSGFGFALPGTTTSIDGIKVTVTRRRSGGTQGDIYDDLIRVVKGGAFGGNNYSSPTAWSTGTTAVDYGSASDLWGLTWTYADINASNFGVQIRTYGQLPSDRSADIDSISVQVTYTDAAGITGDYFWQGSVVDR